MHPVIKSFLDIFKARKEAKTPRSAVKIHIPTREELPRLAPHRRRRIEVAKMQVRLQRKRTAGPPPARAPRPLYVPGLTWEARETSRLAA